MHKENKMQEGNHLGTISRKARGGCGRMGAGKEKLNSLNPRETSSSILMQFQITIYVESLLSLYM